MKLKLCFFVLLICLLCVSALAEELPKTADIDAADAFRRSCTWQCEGHKWSASDDTASWAFEEIASGGRRREMPQGFCFLYLSVRGDDALGLTEVLLHACIFRNEPIGGRGIMFAANGVRYGFQIDATREAAGAYSFDHYVLPMDEDGLALVDSLANAGGMVYAYGDGKPFRARLVPDMSLLRILEMLPDWYRNYSLWEENAAYWPENRPIAEVVALSEPDEDGYVNVELNLLDTGNSEAVLALQEALSENGFIVKKKDGKYGSATTKAVRAAQRQYDLGETGLADLRLLKALMGETASIEDETIVALPETTGLTPTSYRISHELRACAGMTVADAEHIAAASDDLMLVTVEGTFTCTAAEVQDLALECEAWLIADGIYRYPCSVRCEYPGSAVLGTKVLPLQSVRVLWFAEVPVLAVRGRELTLEYHCLGNNGSPALDK